MHAFIYSFIHQPCKAKTAKTAKSARFQYNFLNSEGCNAIGCRDKNKGLVLAQYQLASA